MITNNEYVTKSIELHLFFARIMREHAIFLEIGFLEKNKDYQKIANEFQDIFTGILNSVVQIADNNITESFILAKEMITDYTIDAEKKTTILTGININTNITFQQNKLSVGKTQNTNKLNVIINELNISTIKIIENFIYFKKMISTEVTKCNLFTTNYPLFILHLINETKIYHTLLIKLQNKEQLTAKYMLEQELSWNDKMKEHALFIRGSLDPTENDLIIIANNFAKEYEQILKNQNYNLNELTTFSLNETIAFQKFKETGVINILNCEIKSIILPLLADHVLREANHFIRLLKSINHNYS